MIGKDHVLFIQNGDPALLKVVNIVTGETRKEFPLPVKNPKSVHGQFRHARLTSTGTLIVAHMDAGKVAEYDMSGKELWSFPAPGAWGVTPLKNDNFLVIDRARRARGEPQGRESSGSARDGSGGVQDVQPAIGLAAAEREHDHQQLGQPGERRSSNRSDAGGGGDARQKSRLGSAIVGVPEPRAVNNDSDPRCGGWSGRCQIWGH